MRIRSGLTILTAVAVTSIGGAVAIAHTASAQTDPNPMIIGGETVSSAPWAAAVFNNGGFSCSGSIVADRYVLTAHHCILGDQMSVRGGSVFRASGGTVANVIRTVSQHDLALLQLDRSVGTTYVTLADADPPIGSTNTIFGWGQTCQTGCGASGQLKTATVRFDQLSRDAEGGRALQSSRINGNAWYGDSGGPQFYNDQVVGVASTADGQRIQNYASVANSVDWIRSIIGSGGLTPPAGASPGR
jgi:secreted trypsin-like serine protease